LTLDDLLHLILAAMWVGVMFGMAASLAGLLTWVERKMSALIQDRIGPNRANIRFIRNWRLWGLIHPLADVVKLLLKEDFVPRGAFKILHTLAPMISLTAPLVVFSVIPFAGPLHITWKDITAESIPLIGRFFPGDALHLSDYTIGFQVADLNIGIIFVFAITSLSVYGLLLGGWSSNNKFSFLGAMRAASQMFSYEVALSLSVIGVIMMYGSASLAGIVERQGYLWLGIIPKWGIITQPLAFFLFLACGVAEIKRVPFDLPEGESEIIAGFFTEYSSAKFMMFFFGEFIEVVLLGAMITTLFLGGWQVPWLSAEGLRIPLLNIDLAFANLAWVNEHPMGIHLFRIIVSGAQFGAFFTKLIICIWFLQQARWTFPRFRYDQIMKMGWKMILPLSMLNILGTGFLVLFEERFRPAVHKLLGY
jgi:NADH-quinone oxidoreductase subunit H